MLGFLKHHRECRYTQLVVFDLYMTLILNKGDGCMRVLQLTNRASAHNNSWNIRNKFSSAQEDALRREALEQL